MNLNLSRDESQERSAFGDTEPLLNMRSISSASTERLSEFIVNVFEAVPAIVVDAADMEFTLMLSKYPVRQ